MGHSIFYNTGYKYQLVRDYTIQTGIKPNIRISAKTILQNNVDINTNDYIELNTLGFLTIRKGYAWDGPSGPTLDTKNFMRGSLVHDVLYQLIRSGGLTKEKHKDPADRLLQRICIEDGMSKFRAWYVYHAVRLGGGSAVDKANRKSIVKAPR